MRSRNDNAGTALPAAAERFRLLFLPHLDAAYNYARFLARDPIAAEDIVQDAFLRACRSSGDCHSNEKAWILTIVRNCFFDWTKANRKPGHDVDLTKLSEQRDNDDPATLLQRKGEIDTVRAMVAALPEPFREVLVLRELEEMSYREIADLMKSPIGTVMSRLARARQMLAALLLDDVGQQAQDGADRPKEGEQQQ